MTTRALFDEVRMPRLSRLLQEIQRGEILIPRTLRPFVWTDEQRLALVDSIYSGYPIGAILVWRTQKHRLTTYETLGPLRLPPEDGGQSTRQYLLDGHQRMATLFAALGPGLYAEGESAGPPWIEDDEERGRWPIHFDLEAETRPFRLVPRGVDPPITLLPLDRILDPFGLRELEDRLWASRPDRKLKNRVRSIAETFRDYLVPVTPIVTEDLAKATECFERINSGTPLGTAS